MEQLSSEQQFSSVSFIAAEINEEFVTRLEALEKIAAEINPAMMNHPSSIQALLEQRPRATSPSMNKRVSADPAIYIALPERRCMASSR